MRVRQIDFWMKMDENGRNWMKIEEFEKYVRRYLKISEVTNTISVKKNMDSKNSSFNVSLLYVLYSLIVLCVGSNNSEYFGGEFSTSIFLLVSMLGFDSFGAGVDKK